MIFVAMKIVKSIVIVCVFEKIFLTENNTNLKTIWCVYNVFILKQQKRCILITYQLCKVTMCKHREINTPTTKCRHLVVGVLIWKNLQDLLGMCNFCINSY